MAYEESLSFLDRIKDATIGAPVKGRLIEFLFIGPTDWGQMTDFMNLQIEKCNEVAVVKFSHQGKNLSIYGASVTMVEPDLPRYDLTNMDDWEMIISN